MWHVLSETEVFGWFFLFFLERAFTNVFFPVFPTPAARQPGIAVQPPEPGAAGRAWGRGAGPGAVPARRGAAGPAAARLHPHHPARRPCSTARTRLLGPRAPRGAACAPAAGIRAAARATGTAPPTASPELQGKLSELSCSGPWHTAWGSLWSCSSASLLGVGSFLSMCSVMNDFSSLEEQQSQRFSYLLKTGKTHVVHSFLVSQMPLGGNWRLLLWQGK